MLVRSPRRFMLLAFIAFAFIFVVLQRSPWAHSDVYEHIKMFSSGMSSGMGMSGEKMGGERVPGVRKERLQKLIEAEEAWRMAEEGATKAVKDVPTSTSAEARPTKVHPPWVTDPARTEPVMPHIARPTIKEEVQSMLKWDRPTWGGHWPPFDVYIDKGYDPNRWEQFDMLVAELALLNWILTN
jgi:hypothetical protein